MPKMADPPWVISRRCKFATRVRDAVYGFKARPFSRIARHEWVRVLMKCVRTRELRYTEAALVALAYGAEVRSREALAATPETDERLRRELSARLVAAARAKGASPMFRDGDGYFAELMRARAMATATQSMLDGKCPLCGEPLPCAGCSFPRVAPDGRGSLRPLD